MAGNENTRAPAGGSEPVSTIIKALAAIVNMGSREFRQDPGHEYIDREQVMQIILPIRDAAYALSRALASAPASAPLPLTDQRILDLVTENAEGSGWLSKPGCWGALNRFARAIERECLAAAPVEPLKDALEEFDHQLSSWARVYPESVFPEPDMTLVRTALEARGITIDSVSASNMRHVAATLNKLFEPVRAALSGGSPEPVSGSEGEEEGGTRAAFDVGVEPGKPVCVFDTRTGDVVAYIPNGKTKVTLTGVECEPCTQRDVEMARRIAAALSEGQAERGLR